MDIKEQSPSPENTDRKAKFHKSSSDASGRKYRRHSSGDGSSSPDESPGRDHPSSPINAKEDSSKFRQHGSRRKVDEKDVYKDSERRRYGKDYDSYRYSGRYMSRSSHSYSRNDEHERHEKGYSRPKDYAWDMDRYGRGKDENNVYRSRGKEKESFSPENDKDREDLSRGYESRRKKDNVEELGRDGREHDGGDRVERKENSRISRGHTNGGNRTHSLGEKRESSFRSDSDGYHHKDASNFKRDGYRLARDKDRTDNWDLKNKDPKNKGTELYLDDTIIHKDSDNTSTKKLRMFSSIEDPTQDDHNQMKESHKASEIAGLSQAHTYVVPNAATDLNAAKFAAMKAAEMVNKNLAGGFGPMGYMSTEQKKKLLWGNKKNAAIEESGSHWDVSLIADPERQEKFHKLMGVKGETKAESKPDSQDSSSLLRAERQKELQLDLEKQYTAGLQRRDGRTVGLGL